MAIAHRQQQAMTVDQLRSCGLSDSAIETRVRRGWLIRVHRGVYVLGASLGVRTTEMAAILACRSGSVVAGPSGAYLWTMLAYPAAYATVIVAVPGTATNRRQGIKPLQRRLARDEITRHDGVPVTTPARTLFDLASVAPDLIDRAFDEAVFRKCVRPERVLSLLERYPGARGARVLRELAKDEAAGRRSRLEGERRTKALIRAAGLPMPEVNSRLANLGGIRPDMLWRELRVVVEFDGFATHGDRRSFEDDRSRDARLQAAGYRIVRITWRQLTRRPHEVVAQLAAVLALAGSM